MIHGILTRKPFNALNTETKRQNERKKSKNANYNNNKNENQVTAVPKRDHS